jgi:hypothetical protein
MREARLKREAAAQDGFISSSVQLVEEGKEGLDEDDLDEEDYDSDEVLYDSEEEAEAEAKFREQMFAVKYNGKTQGEVVQPDDEYDANKQAKIVQMYKAAEGVSFVEYD